MEDRPLVGRLRGKSSRLKRLFLLLAPYVASFIHTTSARSLVYTPPDAANMYTDVEHREEREQPAAARISFLFLAYSCFYLEPVWLRYFAGVPKDQFSIVVHHDGLGGRWLDLNLTSTVAAFSGMYDAYNIDGGREAREATRISYVPVSEPSKRFSNSLAKAQYEILMEAYKDEENECFVFISDTTVPLLSFTDLRSLWLDENGRCRRASIITTEKKNCGLHIVKGSTWPVLPRAQVDMIAAADPDYVIRLLLQIRPVLKFDLAKNSEYFKTFERPCTEMQWGAMDEYFLPTLLSTLYALPQNEERAVLHKESSWTRGFATINYWLDGMVPELLIDYCINCGELSKARRLGGHPVEFDIKLLSKHRFEDLQHAIGSEFVRKLVSPAVKKTLRAVDRNVTATDREQCTRLALMYNTTQLSYV